MRGRRGIYGREAAEEMLTCRDCPEPGEVVFAGGWYCGRCALLRLITALRAEVAVVDVESALSEQLDGVLIDQ
jgi:hypothetical protein